MMKRFLLLIVVLIVTAVIIVLALRHKNMAAAVGIASLAPADTALLIHIPDLESSRDAWHRTDLYQLYREPAVQDFLRKPKAQLPKKSGLADAWRDSTALRIRDGFLATNSVDTLRLI